MAAHSMFTCIITVFLSLVAVAFPLQSIACQQDSCIAVNNYITSQQDAWWVAGASFRDHAKHQNIASQIMRGETPHFKEDDFFPIKGHVLTEGKGDVLVYRNIFKGWSWISDSGDYTQITIATPKPLVGSGEMLIGSPSGAMVFYTSGIPSFRNYCFGYATKGKIVYHTSTSDARDINNLLFSKLGIASGVWAEISAQFILADSEDANQECGRCGFNANIIFQPRNVSFVNQEVEK